MKNKKIICFVIFFVIAFISNSLLGQDILIKTSGDTIKVSISKISYELISYSYPNESIVYELPKEEFIKAIYKSGRVEVFNNKSKLNSVAENTPLQFNDSIILTIGIRHRGAIKEINLDGVVFVLNKTLKILNIPYVNIQYVWFKNNKLVNDDLKKIALNTRFVDANPKLQDKIVKLNGDIINCSVLEITDDNIKYKYEGENFAISISKNIIKKIIFSTGRVINIKEEIIINGIEDCEKVQITTLESDVEGMHRGEQIHARAWEISPAEQLYNLIQSQKPDELRIISSGFNEVYNVKAWEITFINNIISLERKSDGLTHQWNIDSLVFLKITSNNIKVHLSN